MARKSSVTKNTDIKGTEKNPVVKGETVEKKDVKKETAAAKKEAPAKKETSAAEKASEKAAPAAKKAESVSEGKEAEKKASTRKKAEEKAPVKPGRKPAAKKAMELVPEVYLQYAGSEIEQSEIVNRIKEQYISEGHRAGNIKSLKVYLKPEERTAYYVINDKTAGRVALF